MNDSMLVILAMLLVFSITILLFSMPYKPAPTAIAEPTASPEPSATPEPIVTSKPITSEPSDEVFEELFDNVGLPEEHVDSCKQHLKDYFSGNWDGVLDSALDGSVHVVDSFFRSYTLFNSEFENPVQMSIDYSGPFEVKEGDNCSFAYDVSSGTIEQWQFFQEQFSWEIPSFGGDNISYQIISFSSTENDTVARVTVYDNGKILATYDLKDNGMVAKLN